MKHPVKDRILVLLCALVALAAAAGGVALLIGKVSLEPVIAILGHVSANLAGSMKIKLVVCGCIAVLVLVAFALISMMLPAKKKRSSNFAIQRNENGMVRISLKALETLVQKCLNQHAELKVVTSSLYSDEESIRVDVHITLQSDISMPLAISALQKQIKKYLEACSGVMVQEVRVFVDGTMPATEETMRSPFAIPMSLLGLETEALPGTTQEEPKIIVEDAPVKEQPMTQEAVEQEPVKEEAAREETAQEEPLEEAVSEEKTEEQEETTEKDQGETV